ncbi:MAG TPA: hypothetical protein VG897_13220 [Terriglobales bacterium]|nr:hypothetical protein [Terriglobales bacterium]
MADLKNLETLINQAVEEVLQKALPDLRQNLVQQVLQALEPQLTAEVTPPAPSLDSETLNDCVAAIQKGTTQVEILDALIEAASNFAARTALFVVRGTNAVGWRARGFSDNDAVRSTPLELSSGLAGKATQSHGPVTGPSSEFTAEFPDKFGASAQDAWMLPLLVRDKAVALIYADGGTDGQLLDAAALQCLVRVTGLWLEVFATRKATGGATTVTAPSSVRDSALPERRAMAAAAVPAPATHAPEPVPQPEPPKPARVIVKPPVPEPVPHPVPAVAPVPSGEEGEVHKKARRFAKLLVDEIKLYNQAKVTEGKQHRDLYDRLREDIEKSRASYDKRYGNTVAKDGDYFNQELIRILADNDTGLLGNNFPR